MNRLFGGKGDDIFVVDDPDFLGGGGAKNIIRGGDGFDTLVLRLDEGSLAEFQAALPDDMVTGLRVDALKLQFSDIEEIVIADRSESLSDLATGDLQTRIDEAELWGFL